MISSHTVGIQFGICFLSFSFHEPLGELEDTGSLIFKYCWRLFFYLCYNFLSNAIEMYKPKLIFRWWFFCKFILFNSNIGRLSWRKFIHFSVCNDQIELACWNKGFIKLADMFSYFWIWWYLPNICSRSVLLTDQTPCEYRHNKDEL